MWAYLKFRIQRQLRRSRRNLRLWRIWSANYLDRHVWGKWRQLGAIRRFVVMWWLIMAVSLIGTLQQTANLKKTYLSAGPAPGGVYNEGLVGSVKSLNPILAASQDQSDASRLIFSGLTRLGPDGTIKPDLADSWKVSDDGKTYSFHLRPHIMWQDGSALTAEDVAFTLNLIQNPDTRSPLASSWQGVTVTVKDDSTVEFGLPNPFAPFIYSTTFGLLPQHLLNGIDPAALRISNFNQQPIGTGPFKLLNLRADGKEIDLVPNPSYYAGAPLLQQFNFRFYDNELALRQAFAKHQVDAIGQVNSADVAKLGPTKVYDMDLLDEVGLFIQTTGPILSDTSVRQAISTAINRSQIAQELESDVAAPVTLPLLSGQLGYSVSSQPPQFNIKAAATELDAAGWTLNKQGHREHNGQLLRLKLATADSGDYPQLVTVVKAQLEQIGISVDVAMTNVKDLQQSYIRPRNYDLLLYGIAIGPDPDVYAYWQSSQVTDPGLNLSEYSSAAADKELEAARLTSDDAIRAARYKKFLSIWVGDTPAVMLYQPTYLYVTDPNVQGVVAQRLGDPSDRFYGVEKWTVNTQPVQRRQ